jgi:hypothetical protein
VRKFAGQGLRDRERRKIAVGQNDCRFCAKKFGEFDFKLRVNLVIAGGGARRGDI